MPATLKEKPFISGRKPTLNRLLIVAALLFLFLSALGYFPDLAYVPDNLSNFRVLYFYAEILLLFLCLFQKFKAGVLCALVALFVNLADMVPLYFQSAPVQRSNLSIASLNLWGDKNKQYGAVIEYVKTVHPDVLCVNEISILWMRELIKGLPEYAYRFDQGVSGGSAIFSRIPIVPLVRPSNVKWYGVRGILSVNGTTVTVIAEHPKAPFQYQNWVLRNADLALLSRDATQIKTPLVLIGDLNCTVWSPYFRKLRKLSGLIDTEFGNGIQPSWTTRLLLFLPIDHCLVSKQIRCARRVVGPVVGSDHLPVYVELLI